MSIQNPLSDPAITKAVVAMRGLCGRLIGLEDVDFLRAVLLGDDGRKAGCVAVISHGGHVHYLAAVLGSNDSWVIEQAAQTSSDQGVPRIAPAIFIGPDSRFSVVGWAPSASATRMVLEIGSYRSPPTPIETGIVIAQFNPTQDAVTSGSRILYFDDTGELHGQSFSATGGFVGAETAVARER